MNRTMFAALTRVLTVSLLPLLPLGCNDDEDIPSDAFRVTPASAHLARAGDSVVLQAIGGLEPITWSLSDTGTTTQGTNNNTVTNYTMGTVSGTGRTVTFTRGAAPGANTVTATDKRTWTASATIYFDVSTSSVPANALHIEPDSVDLTDNRDTAVFIATGGTQPYSWALADGLLGHLDVNSGGRVVYTRDRAGNNTIILTDASNTVKTATVSQPDSTTALSVSPTSATLANNGDTVVFLSAGGTGPYTWYVADSTRGHLSGSSGDTVVYTRDSEGNNSVVLRDRYGDTVVGSVVQSTVGSGLSVTPSSANIGTDGDIVVLVASGGTEPYNWSVAISSRGTLDSTHGTSVIYTRTTIGNNTVQLTDAAGSTIAIPITQSDSTPTLTVTPSSANLTANGEVVALVASGGIAPYTWSVVIPARGTLSAGTGTAVTYTRTTIGNNTVQVTDANGNIVTVPITQSTSSMTVSPSSATLAANGEVVVLVASGGTTPYTWTVITPARGTLSSGTGTSVVYTRTTAGNNTVQLTDADGSIITIPITQTDTTPVLSVAPNTANLTVNGDVVVLVASGGTAPYNWTVAVPARGSLSAGVGTSVTYTRTTIGNNTVQLTDANGSIKTVSVTQPDATTSLGISPTSANLGANGDATIFAASGGTPPYTWSLADSSRGSLSALAGTPVTYTRTTSGNNTVVLTDSLGRLATALVTQSPPNQLAASTNPGSLTTNGALSVITVSGGLPPYTWTLVNGNGVILSTAAQGVSGIYQRTAAGDNAIVVHDANLIQVSVVISQP